MKTFKQTLREAALDGQRDQAKTTVAQVTDTSMDQGDLAYATLKRDHPDVHHYITREAPVAVDPVQTLRMIRQVGKNTTLMMMKDHFQKDAKKLYSSDFPLAESVSNTQFKFEQAEPWQSVLDFHLEKQENVDYYKKRHPYNDDEVYHHLGHLPQDAMVHGKLSFPSGHHLQGWMKPYPSIYHMTKDLWPKDDHLADYSAQSHNARTLDKIVRHVRNKARRDFGGPDMVVKKAVAHFSSGDFPIQTVHMSNGTHDIGISYQHDNSYEGPRYEIHHSGGTTTHYVDSLK